MLAISGFSKRNYVTGDNILSASKRVTIIYLYGGSIKKMAYLMVIWWRGITRT